MFMMCFFLLSFQRKHSSHLAGYNALTVPRKRKAENPVPSTSRQLKLGETKIVNQRNVDNVVIESSTILCGRTACV